MSSGRRVSGDELGAADVALLMTRTGGNPFFVSEYARLPKSEREAGELPLAVRSVLGRRLHGLDAGTLQVLRTAAVIGEVLEIPLLRAVTRLDVDELAELLDEAADEHIVVVAPGSRSYAFAHGLLREELLAGMTDARRQRLHARVAEGLSEGNGSDDLVRRAGHLLAALPLVDPDEVFRPARRRHWTPTPTGRRTRPPIGGKPPFRHTTSCRGAAGIPRSAMNWCGGSSTR